MHCNLSTRETQVACMEIIRSGGDKYHEKYELKGIYVCMLKIENLSVKIFTGSCSLIVRMTPRYTHAP